MSAEAKILELLDAGIARVEQNILEGALGGETLEARGALYMAHTAHRRQLYNLRAEFIRVLKIQDEADDSALQPMPEEPAHEQ